MLKTIDTDVNEREGKPNLKIFNQIPDFIYETNDLEIEMHWERIKAKLENDIKIKLMN